MTIQKYEPNVLQDDEAVVAVTTDKQREQFLAQLNDAEEWLYEDGENAPATDHQYAQTLPDFLALPLL